MGANTIIGPNVVDTTVETKREEETDYEKTWDANLVDGGILLPPLPTNGVETVQQKSNNKRIISKMRKLSISELSRHGRSTKRKYKVAFYVALTTISILFLYLIYQNLFNDR